MAPHPAVQTPADPVSPGADSAPSMRATGIEAFDRETGGLPSGTFTLVAGGEGTGKTTFGLEFLCKGLEAEERVFLISPETPESWLKGARAFNWPLDAAVENGNLNILYQKSQVPHIVTNEEELEQMLEMLEGEILPWEPSRLVIDSAVPFIELLHPEFRKMAIHQLTQRLAQMGLTTVMMTRMPASGETVALRKQMEALCGCSIHLDEQKTPDGEHKRRMVIRKHSAIDPPYPVYNFSIEQGQGILTEGANAVPLQAPSEEVKLPRKAPKGGLFAAAMSKTETAEPAGSEPAANGEKPEEATKPEPPKKKKPVRFSFKAPPTTDDAKAEDASAGEPPEQNKS